MHITCADFANIDTRCKENTPAAVRGKDTSPYALFVTELYFNVHIKCFMYTQICSNDQLQNFAGIENILLETAVRNIEYGIALVKNYNPNI